jgi:hypothetical protein
MRRGLMGWNAEELPVAVLQARLARLRAAMAKAGMDAFILYTNNTRPAAVAHVTGFTPYWSDALMLVPGPARRCSPRRCRSGCRSGSGPPIR